MSQIHYIIDYSFCGYKGRVGKIYGERSVSNVLPDMHKDLFEPKKQHKNPGMLVCICNPNFEAGETSSSLLGSAPEEQHLIFIGGFNF